MLSTICSAKQKSLQMCAELRHCQRWVTNGERQRVPQWRTRDGKTSLSVSRRSCSRYRQIAAMAAQKNNGKKWEMYTSTEEKLKEKTIKSTSEYASKASPNGPLNIYVAGMPRKNMIDWKQSLGLIQMQSANESQDNVSATRSLIIKTMRHKLRAGVESVSWTSKNKPRCSNC